MIIGLSGKAGVGKTTLAKIAEEKFGFNRTSFAKLLKEDLISYLTEKGCIFNPARFYGTPDDKQEYILVTNHTDIPDDLLGILFLDRTPVISYRSAMQWFGDWKRAENPDYWLQRFMDKSDFSNDLIIEDVRFLNEATLIHALGGILTRINWPTHNYLDNHPSETQLDDYPSFDSVITKEHNISVAEFQDICIEHINLWLGFSDETLSPANASMSFNPSSLLAIWNNRENK